jgi:hypothetical protein
MRQAKAMKCSPAKVVGSRSRSRAERRNRAIQANERSTTHRRGNNTTPRLAYGSLTTSNFAPCAAAAVAGASPGWP